MTATKIASRCRPVPPTVPSMTAQVGQIQQRLPQPKGRKPSLLEVSMERVGGMEAAAQAKTHLREQADPAPVEVPVRREIAEIDLHVGAGTDKSKERQRRALTQVERMYRDGAVTQDEWLAGDVLRSRFLAELGHSEGVAATESPVGSGPAWCKADRKAQAIPRRNRSSMLALADFLFSMVGLYDEEGAKIYDPELAVLLVRAVTETVDAVTLTEVGAKRTAYTGQRQQPAAGGAILKELLRRGAAHLRYVKVPEWRDAMSWRVVDKVVK